MSIAKKEIPLRNRSIKIRVSEDEFNKLNTNKTGPQLAPWLRELGLSGEAQKRDVVVHKLPPELVRNLAGIGSNLNQLARHVNSAYQSGELDISAVVLPLLSQLRSTEKALDMVREFLNDR